jgi:hypothetical protein
MRLLIVMLTIVLPVILVLGIFGWFSLLYDVTSTPQTFFILLVVVGVFIGIMLYFLRRKRLI